MALLARLFRCLRVDAIVEPVRIFADLSGGGNNQRPDILLRNPRGFGRQVIIDVAITGIDGQSRTIYIYILYTILFFIIMIYDM